MSGNLSEPMETDFCPVCRVRFRGVSLCPRCGADLTCLMLIQAHAYSQRQSARHFLRAGDARKALAAAKSAQRLHATPQGGILETVCAILDNANGPDRPEVSNRASVSD